MTVNVELMRHIRSLYNSDNNEFRVDNETPLFCFYLYVYFDCVCVTLVILTSKFNPIETFCNC
jgi:hypothetical protein